MSLTSLGRHLSVARMEISVSTALFDKFLQNGQIFIKSQQTHQSNLVETVLSPYSWQYKSRAFSFRASSTVEPQTRHQLYNCHSSQSQRPHQQIPSILHKQDSLLCLAPIFVLAKYKSTSSSHFGGMITQNMNRAFM